MDFIKKNLAFTIVVALCVLVFLAGAYMAFTQSSQISKAKQAITGAEAQLNNARFADPAPTEENVKASEENLAKLESELEKVREVLERGARINTSSDGIEVTASIQQFIAEYRRKASQYMYTDSNGEEKPIDLPDNIGFGFEVFRGSDVPTLENGDVTAQLDMQRHILSYLLDKLYESKPHSLVLVERELLEAGEDAAKNSFKIDDAITAKVPGAIDTMGFRVTFSGYSDSLRNFLNQLRKFDLPIVVRSIQVERPSAGKVTEAPRRDAIADIFGGAFGADASQSAVTEDPRETVVSQNVSKFIVELEFIQVILSADKNV